MSGTEIEPHSLGRRVLLVGDAIDPLQDMAAALGEAGSYVAVLVDRPPGKPGCPPMRDMSTTAPIISSEDLLDRVAVTRYAERYISDYRAPDILCVTQSAGKAQRVIEASAIDWDRDLNEPLRKVSIAISAIVPSMSQRGCRSDVVAIILSDGVTPTPAFGVSAVLGRAMMGLFESLRAELLHSPVNISIVLASRETFLCHGGVVAEAALSAIRSKALYAFAGERDPERISAYFRPLLATLAATSAGPTLPDVGPMGAIYLPDNLSSAPP